MPFNREELLTAVEENPETFFEILSHHLPNATFQRNEQMRRMCFGVPVPFFNGVALARLSIENSDRLIKDAIDEMNATGMPWSWQVGPTSTPFDLATRLQNHGLRFSHEMPVMVSNLSRSTLGPSPKGFKAIPVDDPETLDTYLEVAEQAFGLPEMVFDVMRRAQHAIGFAEDAPARNFLGSVNGVPVCTGTVFYSHGIAGIYTIGTPAVHRGKGYGTAITEACMVDARRRGFEDAFLQSSKMGYSVYQSLGFQDICKLAIYVPIEP
jgi:hypothetical protein